MFRSGCESCDGWFHGACVDVTVEKYPHLKVHYYTKVDLKLSAPTTPPSARDDFHTPSVPKKAVARISLSNSIRSVGRPKHPSKNKRYRNKGFSFMDRIDRSCRHNGRNKSVAENLPPKMVRSRSENSFPQDGRVDLREPEHDLKSVESLRKHPKINKTASASERRQFDDTSQHRKMDVRDFEIARHRESSFY
ncbi:hypothetical protein RvY_07488-2 [Ramazzottius varieornatus]|uniref:Uncharacterized protein n=1 Tax=Ramazzottius varieornatus TaxID=947166 RepID=A0A1D1VAT8_RAMVA|nr:hypothetical protein RvY_07488-2 [Ramazzottius varieornatus]